MGAIDAILVGMIAPVILVFLLRRAFRVPADRLGWRMLAGGIASVLLALPLELMVIEPGVALAVRFWPDWRAAYLADAVMVGLIEELLKIGVIYWLLAKSTTLTWRRFAILAAWTGAGFAGAENWLYIQRHGGEVMILRSFTASPMHVLNAIVAARLLWQGAQENARDMTVAAFCLSVILHASYNSLISISKVVSWTFLLALLVIAVFAWAALSRRDEPLSRATI